MKDLIIEIDHGEVKKDKNYYRIYSSSKIYLINSTILWGEEFLKINDTKINLEEWKSILSIYLMELNKTSFFPLDILGLKDIVEIVSQKTFPMAILDRNEGKVINYH
ncbi:hypothetical protein E1100_15770 [Vibrio owensii]|uniref:hypothetical protein n=1 Tax=Vibrio owensii TaxID=696485 RepID=UPI001043C352|nr:hypothetical protein [Vibrio owensii]TDE22625.1 hypothetical protein E1100_15770 [Vibrio owensii]